MHLVQEWHGQDVIAILRAAPCRLCGSIVMPSELHRDNIHLQALFKPQNCSGVMPTKKPAFVPVSQLFLIPSPRPLFSPKGRSWWWSRQPSMPLAHP